MNVADGPAPVVEAQQFRVGSAGGVVVLMVHTRRLPSGQVVGAGASSKEVPAKA